MRVGAPRPRHTSNGEPKNAAADGQEPSGDNEATSTENQAETEDNANNEEAAK